MSLRVLPFPGAYTAPGSFSILRFGPADLPDIVYVEQLTSAMYLDKRSDVDRYTEVIDRLSAASASAGDSRSIIRALLSN